jgi:hypothetical protein
MPLLWLQVVVRIKRLLKKDHLMGWASGSGILANVWATVREFVPTEKRGEVLATLMGVFANEDCDTLEEVIDDDWPESQAAFDTWSERQ